MVIMVIYLAMRRGVTAERNVLLFVQLLMVGLLVLVPGQHSLPDNKSHSFSMNVFRLLFLSAVPNAKALPESTAWSAGLEVSGRPRR